ncbi:MAG: PAS domain S-box protein [Anaerolineaceae bacterium]|nr:PAS domain S-box protein [Anaerolineaceae bacterium]
MIPDTLLAQIRAGDAHYQIISELTGDVIFLADTEGRYTYFTTNVAGMCGYTPTDMIGQPMTALVHPHWRDRATQFYGDQLREYIEETTLELPVLTAQHDEIWVRLMVRLLLEENRPAGYLGVVRDITAHKQSIKEWDDHIQSLELLRHVNDELIYTLNLPYVLSVALDATVRLTGADAGAIHLLEDQGVRTVQVIGAFPPNLLNTYVDSNKGIVGRVLRSGEGELVLDAPNDPDYLALIPGMKAQLTVPLISQSQPTGVLNVLAKKPDRFTQDSFELVNMLAQRVAMVIDNARLYQESQEQLQELQELYGRVRGLEQIKTDMIRIAAHDLRNPLSNILSATYIMQTTLGDAPTDLQREMLDSIDQSVARMKKITSDILSLERIEELAQQPLKDIVELDSLIAQAIMDFERQASEKGIVLAQHDQPENIKVKGDSAQLGEVIANLVSNAIKYTPIGGSVTISLEAKEGQAIFEVKDTGYGIPEALQGRLFQPFFRAKTAETRSIEGTGLGLHLVKNIIERHGGQMRFQSAYGKGSTFGFDLPLVK